MQDAYDEWRATTDIEPINFKEVGIRLFPNPTKDLLNIEIPENLIIDNSDLSIIDKSGKEILRNKISSRNEKVNLEQLSSGLYFIKIKTTDKIFTDSFMKN